MSTQTFVNALIGLAREYKKKERVASKRNYGAPEFGDEVREAMIESGYFHEESAAHLGAALQVALVDSDPRRKPK